MEKKALTQSLETTPFETVEGNAKDIQTESQKNSLKYKAGCFNADLHDVKKKWYCLKLFVQETAAGCWNSEHLLLPALLWQQCYAILLPTLVTPFLPVNTNKF